MTLSRVILGFMRDGQREGEKGVTRYVPRGSFERTKSTFQSIWKNVSPLNRLNCKNINFCATLRDLFLKRNKATGITKEAEGKARKRERIYNIKSSRNISLLIICRRINKMEFLIYNRCYSFRKCSHNDETYLIGYW